MKVLEFDNVSYNYIQAGKQLDILKDATYQFEAGTFYAIIGPSGSGKTTALALASGLDVPKNGNVLYKKSDLQKIGLNKFRRENVAIIFQSYNLLSYMTALQNVVAAMEISRVKRPNMKEYAIELLEKVGITRDMATRSVRQMSGGQQQRVAIARALSTNVDLIVADEPTGNLDKETAADIITIFQKLAKEEGKCIIAVTHSEQLAKVADVVLKLKDGKLVKK